MRILIITDYLPYPLNSGSKIRVYNLIWRIARQHEVALAAFVESPDEVAGIPELENFCARVETVPLRRHHPLAHLAGLAHFALEGKPLELKFLYSDALVNRIRQMIAERDYDVAEIEHSRMALYWDALRATRAARLLTFIDIASAQYARIVRLGRASMGNYRAWLFSQTMGHWEPRYAERFDRCITTSDVDRRALLAANPRLKLDVAPNGVDTQRFQPLSPCENTPAVLFIGTMNYPPCVDAAIYFCDQILPYLRNSFGRLDVWIIGANPAPRVARLVGDGVRVTGKVEDVIPYYQQCAVAVVPLRAGSGTRLKILEAMALGRPVVSTTIGCEGLDVVNEEHLLIANEPREFAAQVRRLLTDTTLYTRLVTNGRRLVETKYDWDAIADRLLAIYAETRAECAERGRTRAIRAHAYYHCEN